MSHGHRKYYERPDGFVYSTEELDAYRIPIHQRDRCVNFLVPYIKCTIENQYNSLVKEVFINMMNPYNNKCESEKNEFYECKKQVAQIALASNSRNMYFNNDSFARSEGVSSTTEARFRKSPVSY